MGQIKQYRTRQLIQVRMNNKGNDYYDYNDNFHIVLKKLFFE